MSILNTTALRAEYAPACTGPWATVHLYGAGVISVRDFAADAFGALSRVLEHHHYATRRADTGAYNCRRITGGTGYSLHAYGIAADLNWNSNRYGPTLVTDMPPAMTAAAKAIRTRSGRQLFGWGGDYRTNKDAMHYEIVCPRADLRSGIDLSTVAGNQPAPHPQAPRPPVRVVAPSGTPALRRGNTGHRVAELQVALNYGTAARLIGDSNFGPSTESAVKNLQRSKGLTADGIYGAKSQLVLQIACNSR